MTCVTPSPLHITRTAEGEIKFKATRAIIIVSFIPDPHSGLSQLQPTTEEAQFSGLDDCESEKPL